MYEWTGVLDCGCKIGPLWDHGRDVPIKITYWWECPIHSVIVGYDSRTGEPFYDRDRKVRTVGIKKAEETV